MDKLDENNPKQGMRKRQMNTEKEKKEKENKMTNDT